MSIVDSTNTSRSITNWVHEIITNKSERVYKFLFLVLIVLIVIFSGLKLYSGLSPVWAPWDVIVLLNGGWRIYQGQTPHVDFYNPVGTLAYIPTALAMKYIGIFSSSLVYGNTFFGALLGLWAWYLARERLSSFNALVFSFFIFILSVSSRPLGYGITNTTYAMIYNRYGYALLSLLFIQLFCPQNPPAKTREFIDGMSTGAILILLLYCKITYFFVGAGSLVVGWVMLRPSRNQIAASGIGSVLFLIIFQLFFRINASDYLGDIQTAALSQSISMRFANLSGSLRENNILLYLIYVMLFLSSVVMYESRPSRAELMRLAGFWFLVTLIIVSGLLITGGNTAERKDLPMYFISGLIILNTLNGRQQGISAGTSSNLRVASLLVVVIVMPIFFGYLMMKDVASIAYSAWWSRVRLSSTGPEQRFHSDTMGDFIIPGNSDWKTAYSFARDVPKTINDGLDLLKPHLNSGTRIFCLCLTDPFSYALGLSPAIGTPLWWDESVSFTDSVFPDPENLFHNVDLVVIPVIEQDNEGCCGNTVILMEQIYGGYLEKNFQEADKSAYWILLARK